MNTPKKYYPLEKKLIDSFAGFPDTGIGTHTASYKAIRQEAFEIFSELGLPTTRLEAWRHFDLTAVYEESFKILSPDQQDAEGASKKEMFRCEVHNLDMETFSMLNGRHYYQESAMRTLPGGVMLGSLQQAFQSYPELVLPYFEKTQARKLNGFTAANAALAPDGMFIYVPAGVHAEKAIQLIKLIDREETLFVQNRNLIILESGSSLTLMHCDDSINHFPSLSNTVTEIFLAEGAEMDLYKLQNLNDQSVLVNTTQVHQQAESSLNTHTLSFNGGMIRNNLNVHLLGEKADAKLSGLYLMDNQQHIDNQIYVNHAVPNCKSSELFKGILDDEAHAVFNGYIYVARDAQQTEAFQQNNNLLLKNTALVDAMPFLEIYADDVKCSHGATIGQLDEEAMFYLRQRGISKENARLLLMYAFAADIIQGIRIEPLRQRIDDMVKKRLRGELSICEKCVLHCGQPAQEIHFDIDYSKI